MQTLADWTSELEALLKEARAVAETGDDAARRATAGKLTDFVVRTHRGQPSERATFKELDRIATEAGLGLLVEAVQDRVSRLVVRTAEFVTLRKELEGQADVNEAVASALRLQRIKRVVESSTDFIAHLLELKGAFKEVGNDELTKKIESLVTGIQNFRNEIEASA